MVVHVDCRYSHYNVTNIITEYLIVNSGVGHIIAACLEEKKV